MSVYRSGKIRLSEDVRPELADVCLPGPDESVLGQYARMRPQLAALALSSNTMFPKRFFIS